MARSRGREELNNVEISLNFACVSFVFAFSMFEEEGEVEERFGKMEGSLFDLDLNLKIK